MSTLVTTNIQTANGTTDLTIKTGNTSSAAIILAANGSGFVIQGNSTSNVMTVNSTAVSYLGTQSLNAVSINLSTNTFTIGTAAYHVSNGYFGIGTSSPGAKLQIGGNSLQYSNLVGVRTAGNQYEFGHPNINGYGSVIGAEAGSGSPFIAFNSGAGTNNNTYKTYGIKGVVIKTDNAGGLLFNTVDNAANTDNQTLTERMRIDNSGNVGVANSSPAHTLRVEGTISALTSVGVGSAVTINTTSTYIANLTSNGTSYVSNGFYVVAGNWGVVSANITLNAANGNYQYLTSNAAYTITAPTQDCAIDILILNGSSAGSLTFSGFTIQSGGTGDTYTTTASSQFILSVRRINGVSTYVWKALQ